MTTKPHFSLKESITQIPTKIKLYPIKFQENLKHHSISISPNNNSSKKIYLKGDKRNKSKSSLFKFNPAYLEQMASYGTNNKTKEKENKEKDNLDKVAREIHEKRLALFEIYNKAKDFSLKKDSTKKETKNKKMSKSMKKSTFAARTHSPKISDFNNSDYDKNNIGKEDDIILVRNKTPDSDVVEHYVSLPEELKEKLSEPELKLVSPSKNIEGNYSHYINGVANSLKRFIEFDYNIIFSKENHNNMKYYYYTSPMIIEDAPKKKVIANRFR